jgi:hypothetical protein
VGGGLSDARGRWAALVLVIALLAGCQIASAPPEVSVTTTRTRGATSVPAAAPNVQPSPSPGAALPTLTATTRPASPVVSPTAVRTPTTVPATALAPTLPLATRLVAATPAPSQRTAGASPGAGSGAVPTSSTSSGAVPTFARATILPPPPTAGPAAGLLPGGGQQLNGEVLSYAASARVLQIRVAGATREVSLAPGATIRRADGTPAATTDVRPGEQVEVVVAPSGDGALVASALTIVRAP